MSEWLERTVDAPNILDRLVERFGKERINEIEQTDTYKDAQAVMAMALSMALDKTKLSRGKRRQVGSAILGDVMTGAISVFLLGYTLSEKENTTDAQ